MSESALVPIEGQYAVGEVVHDRFAPAPVRRPAVWQPIPVPSDWTMREKDDEGNWNEVPYRVKWEILDRPTPKTQKKLHPKGFAYISVDYYKQRLNECFGKGRWTFDETGFFVTPDPYKQVTQAGKAKAYKEVIVEGYIMAPGLAGPIYGVGSAPWAQDDQQDPRFMLATARNSAASNALKNAAKKLGIGTDVKEDEDANRYVLAQAQAAKMFFDQLVEAAKKVTALAIVRKHAPRAIVNDELVIEMLDEDTVDAVLNALNDEYLKP